MSASSLSGPSPPPQPDPRLGAPSHYNREEIVSELREFYAFLPHISSAEVHTAPAGGWPSITHETLSRQGITKTPEAVALLRSLPYISDGRPWVTHAAYSLDYRIVAEEDRLTPRNKPGWLYDAADGMFPPWVVQLTTGRDREGHAYLLDTSDGTVVRYCATGIGGQYEPTYDADDARAWRDTLCDPEIWTLRSLLDEWRDMYRDMNVLGVPQPLGDEVETLGYPNLYSNFVRGEDFEALVRIYRRHGWPDEYDKEACIAALRDWWRDREKA
ncbi:hypothetical protein F5Y09DRAFT_174423 [Xylaria sp. FL1042]|nr:hypothetical protein F5Y09DRAFT_174423 [Xylaria sp. FL1042]